MLRYKTTTKATTRKKEIVTGVVQVVDLFREMCTNDVQTNETTLESSGHYYGVIINGLVTQ